MEASETLDLSLGSSASEGAGPSGQKVPQNPAKSGSFSPGATENDAGCSCCPSLAGDAEAGQAGLTNRRSTSNNTAKRAQLCWKQASESQSNSHARLLVQERVLWGILALACMALVLSLFRLEDPHSYLLSLGALPAQLLSSAVPRGPALWKCQWILGGSPDPWPLWDTEMLGHKADWPHGSANGFAAAMDTLHTSRVAVVGNGPLSQAQRDEIQSADRVVRFNAMNNRGVDERVDIWVVRYNKIPPFNFWGFQQLEDTEIEDVIRQARAVLFLGGSNSHNATEMHLAVEQVLFWFPDMLEQQVQQVNVTGYWDLYNKMFTRNGSSTIEEADTMPSSGLLGLLAVLRAVRWDTQIDLYGFNWSSKSYQLHQMSVEELIVQALAKQFPNLVIHPTACNALYSCDSLCDTNQFRLAVDQQNCKAQLEKSRHGAKVRFIDHHTINNLDWYPDVKKELQDPKVKEELNITLPKPRSQKHHEAWQAGVRAASNKQGGIPILHSAGAERGDEHSSTFSRYEEAYEDVDEVFGGDTDFAEAGEEEDDWLLAEAETDAETAGPEVTPPTKGAPTQPGTPGVRPGAGAGAGAKRSGSSEADVEEAVEHPGNNANRKLKHPNRAASADQPPNRITLRSGRN